MIKVIFFDFDDVLTTDSNGWYTTCKNIQKTIPDVSLEHIIKCHHANRSRLSRGEIDYEDMWDEFCSCIGVDADIKKLPKFFQDTPKNERMFRLCERLTKNYKLGIITTNGKERFSLLEQEWGLAEIFDTRITSAHIGVLKDDKLLYEKALEAAGAASEECIFIDNQEKSLGS